MKKKLTILLLSITLCLVSVVLNNNGVHAEDEQDTFTLEIVDKESTKTFNNIKKGDYITVNNVDNIIIRIKSITTKGQTYILNNVGTDSGVKDPQGRNPLEVQMIKPVLEPGQELTEDDNFAVFNLRYHRNDDPQTQTIPAADTYELNSLVIKTNNFRGVELKHNLIPDMFDDMSSSSLSDISNTTILTPVNAIVYFGETETELTAVDGKTITSIEMAYGEDDRIATIDGNKVKYGSPFFSVVPLKITLDDGTVGYLTLEKRGIEIHGYHGDVEKTNHGSQPGCDLTRFGTDKEKIVATFYYGKDNNYKDYNLVAKLTYADGTVETKTIEGFDETRCIDENLKGGDYLIWAGTSNRPVIVSVTATRAGDVSKDESFNGALFGSGNGVTERFD